MAYTSPASWTAGQLVGASDFNTQIRDNFLALAGTTGQLQAPTVAGNLTVNGGNQFPIALKAGTSSIPFASVIQFNKFDGTGLWQVGSSATTGTVQSFEFFDAVAAALRVSINAAGLLTAFAGFSATTGVFSGTLSANATLAVGGNINVGTTPAVSTGINLPNNTTVLAWRNVQNDGDLTMRANVSNVLEFGATHNSAGFNWTGGGGVALSGTSADSISVVFNGTARKIPLV